MAKPPEALVDRSTAVFFFFISQGGDGVETRLVSNRGTGAPRNAAAAHKLLVSAWTGPF